MSASALERKKQVVRETHASPAVHCDTVLSDGQTWLYFSLETIS